MSDYFDRLALDRALDAIGDAERRLAAAMTGEGAAGAAAVAAWVGDAAGRRPPHPRGGARDREFGIDAVEADGRRQPARRPGAGLLGQFSARCRPDEPLPGHRVRRHVRRCSSSHCGGAGAELVGHGAQPAGDGEVEGRPREGDAMFRLAAEEADVGLFHGLSPVSGGFATVAVVQERRQIRSVPRRLTLHRVKIPQS